MNRPITKDKIEKVNKDVPFKQTLGTDGFSAKFYLTFKEKFSRLFKLFQGIEEDRNLSNLFYKSHNLMTKLYQLAI